MLVFALDLEEVEEVGSSGMDFDEVVVWRRRGSRQLCDFEVEGTLWWMLDSIVTSRGVCNKDMNINIETSKETTQTNCTNPATTETKTEDYTVRTFTYWLT